MLYAQSTRRREEIWRLLEESNLWDFIPEFSVSIEFRWSFEHEQRWTRTELIKCVQARCSSQKSSSQSHNGDNYHNRRSDKRWNVRDDKQIHVCEDISQEKGSGERKKKVVMQHAMTSSVNPLFPLPSAESPWAFLNQRHSEPHDVRTSSTSAPTLSVRVQRCSIKGHEQTRFP